MLVAALAAAFLATAPQEPQEGVADPGPVALEDVTVTGRTLDRMIGDFVGQVAEPNRGRGLARWEHDVCIGVANFRGETAQYLVDRISTVAQDLGIRAGAPGCTPNILVVATADGDDLATRLIAERPRAFRLGGTGMDRGGDALREFESDGRPVRWWQSAMPTNARTGARAVRLPGDCSGNCTGDESVLHYAPKTDVFAASRLSTEVVNNLFRAIVIVDVGKLPEVTALQLADYIAMVSLAQIDPDAATGSYASILNVMDDPTVTDSLTTWDQAYLQGLYSAERHNRNLLADRNEIERSIRTEHGRLREAEGD